MYSFSAPPKNLAKGKQAWQVVNHGAYVAGKSTDGSVDPALGRGSCSHTGNRYHAWWAVDLEASYRIDRVVLATRDAGREYGK